METLYDQAKSDFSSQDRETLASIEKRLKRIERRFAWSAFFGFLNVLIIIGPIIIGIIYLSPILKEYIDKFGPLIQSLPSINIKDNKANVSAYDSLSPQLQAMICNQQVREVFIKQNCPSN